MSFYGCSGETNIFSEFFYEELFEGFLIIISTFSPPRFNLQM